MSTRLSGHFTSPREPLRLGGPGEGALRRSAPMAPSMRLPTSCGQEGKSGIRVNLTCVQVKAQVVLPVSTVKVPNSAPPRWQPWNVSRMTMAPDWWPRVIVPGPENRVGFLGGLFWFQGIMGHSNVSNHVYVVRNSSLGPLQFGV